jgi:hypothetical protein
VHAELSRPKWRIDARVTTLGITDGATGTPPSGTPRTSDAEEPTFFSPGVEFRFPIALIAGNRQSIEAALRRKLELARAVLDGRAMLDLGDGQPLVELAREVSRAA